MKQLVLSVFFALTAVCPFAHSASYYEPSAGESAFPAGEEADDYIKGSLNPAADNSLTLYPDPDSNFDDADSLKRFVYEQTGLFTDNPAVLEALAAGKIEPTETSYIFVLTQTNEDGHSVTKVYQVFAEEESATSKVHQVFAKEESAASRETGGLN